MQRKKRIAGAIAGIGFCILLGSGIALWEHFQGDAKEQQKKTPVSDEVAEIENLNARDHVLDLNHLFEEEDVTWKEKRALKKDAQKQAEMSDGKKKSADKKKDTEKETEGKSEVPQKPNEEPQQPQEPNGEPEVPQGPNEEPEAPQEPQGPNEEPEVPQQPQGPNEEPEAPQQPQEPEVPQKPALPQVSEPGWITGIY